MSTYMKQKYVIPYSVKAVKHCSSCTFHCIMGLKERHFLFYIMPICAYMKIFWNGIYNKNDQNMYHNFFFWVGDYKWEGTFRDRKNK